MKLVMLSATAVVAVALASLLAGCTPEDERGRPPGAEAADPSGCCQQTEALCSSPVTQYQCDELRGKFHQGSSCHLNTGQCGVGRED
ncbi:hypothetical protein SAMN04487965_2069 [Microbulbifer donghaiensis]|uniref:Lipoprotein n=1 Tax=Microbulbifer donghaiensis TaxID=494016 RepID=A0A1M5B4M7_9GAMM|nr:hypothetical protein [Microbulbifer donghaiensis]SHF37405.1 hypothetical protein SAMN04487965_2069 [Microbulbifer donghaiensis]